jgi:hypothetical protein
MPEEIGKFKRTPDPKPAPRPPPSIGEKAVADFLAGSSVKASLAGELPAVTAAPETPEAETSPLEQREVQLEKDLKKAEKAPEMTYEQKVKEHGLTIQEAVDIVNTMFDNNYYEREYKLTARYSILFRTRSTADQDRVLKRIEEDNLQYPASIAQLLAKYNLAASMQKFKQIDFTEKPFDTKLKFVVALPETVLRLLVKKLSEFDELVMDVLDDGAIENF